MDEMVVLGILRWLAGYGLVCKVHQVWSAAIGVFHKKQEREYIEDDVGVDTDADEAEPIEQFLVGVSEANWNCTRGRRTIHKTSHKNPGCKYLADCRLKVSIKSKCKLCNKKDD